MNTDAITDKLTDICRAVGVVRYKLGKLQEENEELEKVHEECTASSPTTIAKIGEPKPEPESEFRKMFREVYVLSADKDSPWDMLEINYPQKLVEAREAFSATLELAKKILRSFPYSSTLIEALKEKGIAMTPKDAVETFAENLAEKLEGAKMDNQPDDMRKFETDEAAQATRPTAEEITTYVERYTRIGELHDIEIIDNSHESATVAIYVEIPWSEVE